MCFCSALGPDRWTWAGIDGRHLFLMSEILRHRPACHRARPPQVSRCLSAVRGGTGGCGPFFRHRHRAQFRFFFVFWKGQTKKQLDPPSPLAKRGRTPPTVFSNVLKLIVQQSHPWKGNAGGGLRNAMGIYLGSDFGLLPLFTSTCTRINKWCDTKAHRVLPY